MCYGFPETTILLVMERYFAMAVWYVPEGLRTEDLESVGSRLAGLQQLMYDKVATQYPMALGIMMSRWKGEPNARYYVRVRGWNTVHDHSIQADFFVDVDENGERDLSGMNTGVGYGYR